MKGKIPKILSVALALVLVLSFSLVTALPVAAARVGEPAVTLALYKVGVAGNYSIVFTTHEALAAGDTISVVFPDDTDLTEYTAGHVTVTTVETITSSAVQGQRVDIVVGDECPAGAVTVAFTADAKVMNPSTADIYQLQVYTSLETTARTSGDYTVYPRSTKTPASVAVVTDTSAAAGTATIYDLDVVLGAEGNITYGQTITIEFPDGTTVPATIATSAVTVEGVAPYSVVVSSQEVTIAIALGEVIANSATVDVIFALGAGLVNPEDAGNYTVDAWTSVEPVAQTSGAYTINAEASADATQLVFSTFPSTNAYNTDGTIVVQAQDQYGNPVTRSGADVITINFTTSNTDTGTLSAATADMGTNANSVTFDYKDTVSGATLTAAVDAVETVVWADAVGTFIVTPQVALLHDGVAVDDYDTITLAIAAAVPGDTIEVGPGTYLENLTIDVVGLNLESTAGRDTTIIDASAGTNGIEISADGVTVEGFTVVGDGDIVAGSGHYGIMIAFGTTGVTVKNNTVTDVVTAIVFGDAATSATVSGNLISDCNGGIHFIAAAITSAVSNNEITDCEGPSSGGSGIGLNASTSSTITGNIVSNGGWGIHIGGNVTTSLLIEDNTLTGNRHDGIKIESSVTGMAGLSITGNSITANEEDGIFIEFWDAGEGLINYNNIYGNGLEGDPLVEVAWLYDIENSSDVQVDATNNYWGDPSGPGDNVNVKVTYSPWLVASDGDSIDSDTITLVAGWNLISLPLIPTDADIDTVLADIVDNVDSVYSYNPDGSWSYFIPDVSEDLTEMNDGEGFWVKMTAADVLVVTGYEYCKPAPEVPPDYEVVAGWNLIGYKFTTANGIIDSYLGDVGGTNLQAIYGYNAGTGAYTIPIDLNPGCGYWIALTLGGTIYPEFEVVPES